MPDRAELEAARAKVGMHWAIEHEEFTSRFGQAGVSGLGGARQGLALARALSSARGRGWRRAFSSRRASTLCLGHRRTAQAGGGGGIPHAKARDAPPAIPRRRCRCE